VRAEFGPDVRGIDAALAWAFGVVPADPAKLTLAGFSDGATYTLGLGRANGDLFSRLVAFSPGFLMDVTEVQRPGIVVSHGTQDSVLPYASSRDVIVPTLRSRGYGVEFHSFDGGHAVHVEVAQAEFRRMVA
jgi:phospholipase/carboxylesterase